jgi:hypothetical protein
VNTIGAETMLEKFWSIEAKLKEAGIAYETSIDRHDGISLVAHVPNEIWEIDVLADGSVDFEIYRAVSMQGEAELGRAIETIKQLNAT